MKCAVAVLLVFVTTGEVFSFPKDKHGLHYRAKPGPNSREWSNPAEQTADYWINNARDTLRQKFSTRSIEKAAKNVILFLGDGMSVTTLAATRMYMGGEEAVLSFEKFPYTALAKTFCVDYQVADSACTATAYLTGVKANMGTLGVTAKVGWEDCDAMVDTANHVYSIAQWSMAKGKKAGLVSTASVTDASPAGVYSHTAEREWQSDTDVINANLDPNKCRDVAYQMMNNEEGKKLNVMLGGGRKNFLPQSVLDEDGNMGNRSDGRNLIQEWLTEKNNGSKAEYVWNREGLLKVADDTEYLLGMFSPDNLPYNLDRDPNVIPSLTEMTKAAIDMLSRNNPNGYFLFVEGAEIDDAHHEARAKKALDETVEFARAVELAVNMTDESDTLIVVTSDHAHTLSYSGYPLRHNDILVSAEDDEDGIAFLTLNYANGPGYKRNNPDGSRHDISQDDTTNKDYQFPAVFPLDSETHGGEDVIVFARGPWAHLFAGVIEQNVIPHAMAYASCVGDGDTACGIVASGAVSVSARWMLTGAVAALVMLLSLM